jgi:hypothetical protein
MTHDHNPIVHSSLCRHEFLFVIMERPLVIEPTKMDRAMQEKLSHAREKRFPPRMRSSKLVMQFVLVQRTAKKDRESKTESILYI